MKKKNTVALGIFLGTSLSLMALTLKESPIIPIVPKVSERNIDALKMQKRKIKQQIQTLQSGKQTQEIRKKINKHQKELGNITKQIRSIRRKL